MKCVTCGQEVVDKLEEAGKRAAAEAERLWKMDIIDPPIGSKDPRASYSLATINSIIRRNGWTWALPYRGNGQPQWCGMTAGWCWSEAGLDPTWLSTYFASTYRLQLWATYQKFDQKGKPNPLSQEQPRRLCVNLMQPLPVHVTPRAGDIVIVGDGEPLFGDHVTICVSYANGLIDTISGNGGGRGPKGDAREGISRRAFAIGQTKGYRPMWLIRPGIEDLL